MIRIACVGDSITFGAHLEEGEQAVYSYPAQLQALLGDTYHVHNFGVSSCTLIHKGQPNVWSQLPLVSAVAPEIVIICLGTNDTCGGSRNCWSSKDDFPFEYRELIDTLRVWSPSPRIFLCAPPPMVLDTPGLDAARKQDLKERQPRQQELIAVIKELATEKGVGFIDLNTPMDKRPELFRIGDGVHPNKRGYQEIARIVYGALLSTLSSSADSSLPPR